MILDYSPKERLDRIVEILAEGVVNLIRYKDRLSSMMHRNMQEGLKKALLVMFTDRSIKSCTIANSFAEVNIERNKQRRYIEPFGKVYSLSQTITRD